MMASWTSPTPAARPRRRTFTAEYKFRDPRRDRHAAGRLVRTLWGALAPRGPLLEPHRPVANLIHRVDHHPFRMLRGCAICQPSNPRKRRAGSLTSAMTNSLEFGSACQAEQISQVGW